MTDELLVQLYYAAQGDITRFRVKARELLASSSTASFSASPQSYEEHREHMERLTRESKEMTALDKWAEEKASVSEPDNSQAVAWISAHDLASVQKYGAAPVTLYRKQEQEANVLLAVSSGDLSQHYIESLETCLAVRDKELNAMATKLHALESQAVALSASVSEPDNSFQSLLDDVAAIDTWYRGSPSYEHDAGWFKDRVVRLIEERLASPDNSQAAALSAEQERQRFEAYFRDGETREFWENASPRQIANAAWFAALSTRANKEPK